MENLSTQIHELPDNVFCKIILQTLGITKYNLYQVTPDTSKFRLISSKFKNVIDQEIGLAWDNTTELDEFDEFPVPCCTLKLRKDPNAEDYFTEMHIPPLRNKDLVQYIWLNCSVSTDSLNRTFINLKHLKVLKLVDAALLNLNANVRFDDLVRLEVLKLYLVGNQNFEIDQVYSMYTGLINILTISNFERLRAITIRLKRQAIRENNFTHAFLKFLMQHRLTIKEIHIELREVTQSSNDWPDVPNFDKRLKDLQMEKLNTIAFFYTRAPQLLKIYNELITKGKDLIEIKGWERGIKDQELIKPIPREVLANNSATLVTIGMEILPEECRPLDCALFSCCTSLEKLYISTMPSAQAELVNAQALPAGLKELEVHDLSVNSEEVKNITGHLIKLDFIRFENIGTENGYGVTLACFVEFCNRRTENIYIDSSSWNVADSQEAYSSHDESRRLKALNLIETRRIDPRNNTVVQGCHRIRNPVRDRLRRRQYRFAVTPKLPITFKSIRYSYSSEAKMYEDVANE